jgi:hypothetical protein
LRVVELEIAINLVGGNMVETAVMATRRLKERVSPDDVRFEERTGIVQRIVVVGFCRVVHHCVDLLKELVDESRVGDVPLNEAQTILGQPSQRGEVAGVRELV